MKTIIIVQARMTSTRLPGKVLKKVLGKPLLVYQLERLRRVKLAGEIVIATTTNETDLPIVKLCSDLAISCFRGPEEDVLARYYGAARQFPGEVIVRLTSDCPLIDPQVIDKVIQHYLDSPQLDYVSNVLERSYPRGMDTEVFSFKALQEAYLEAADHSQREHVTPFIYHQPSRFSLANVSYQEDQSRHRWTVDTPEDLELVTKILEALYPYKPQFTLEDILSLLVEQPHWMAINENIEQKKLDK